MGKRMTKKSKKLEKVEAKTQQIENIINYNRVVAVELANRAKEKKPNKDAFICLQNVNKIYDNLVQAVFDFSLDIKKNEFIVLVGPSGCGKSTTLRMIAGLEEITAGNLFIDKTYANVLPPKDRDISMVFQSYALYPHMSVYNNMAFAMQIRPYWIPEFDKNKKPKMGVDTGAIKNLEKQIVELEKQIANVNAYNYEGKGHLKVVSELEATVKNLKEQIESIKSKPVQLKTLRKYKKNEIDGFVDEAAKILQIEEYLDRKPRELSGGQRQRVALGRAIVKKSKLFLMDEPLSNLDAKLRVSMRSEIKRIHKSIGATTIYVTHDQTEAMTMADRIVIMNKGYIQQIGTPEEIYNSPANVFVATFIGSPAMNIFDAKIKNNVLTLPNKTTLKLPASVTKKIESAIKAKVEKINKFEKEGLEEEYKKQILVDKETAILAMKTNKPKKNQIGTADPLDNIVLSDEEVSACKQIFTKKYEELNSKRIQYNAMLKSKTYDVKFGIRPEHIYIKGSSLEKDVVPSEVKKIKVSISELLGNEYFLHADFGGKDFILKTTSYNPVKEGAEAQIIMDLNKIHIFDAIDDNIIS